MKKIFKIFSVIYALFGLSFISCSGDTSSDSGTSGQQVVIGDDEVAIHLLYADSSKKWNVWAWSMPDKKNYSTKAWPGNMEMKYDPETGGLYYVFKPDTTKDLGLLFVDSTGKTQTSDIMIKKEEFSESSHFYFIYGFTTPYGTAAECKGLKSASIADMNGNIVIAKAYGLKGAKPSDFEVFDSQNNVLSISNVITEDDKITINLANGNISNRPYTIKNGDVTVYANITGELVEGLKIFYDKGDLGVSISGSKAGFKLWAPTATNVNLLLYEDSSKIGNFKQSTVDAKASGSCDEPELKGTPGNTIPMTFDSQTGVWSAADVNIILYKYYKYEIVNNGDTYYVCDINAKVCSADSIAAQLIDIDSDELKPTGWNNGYYNPFGATGTVTKKYSDAMIYEMHIRDWSKAYGETNEGKFDDITDALTKSTDSFAEHLKDLGITHVQIIPMFDYAQVNADSKYNWGYNPYHYNVPEGRYVNYEDTEKKDGKSAVIQMRKMIKAFHDAGIAVNMDVVYNHTSGTRGGSLYDSTIPEYFYRVSDGVYSNGSGCGNEVATNHVMVRKYVIDSLKHWMNDYHINGFRFDLMGLTETDTMAEIYDALYEIDQNVMVYGEPWTGGETIGTNLTTKANIDSCVSEKHKDDNGVACFNDNFRNAIKGSEYPNFSSGHVSGSYADGVMNVGLLGYNSDKSEIGFTKNSCRSINYVECHDNNTLSDKLGMVLYGGKQDSVPILTILTAENLNLLKKQDVLAAAFVVLAQGTPFINGGQEFLRSKWCDENSYESGDFYNKIDLTYKTTYKDVYNSYRGLIKLRHDNSSAFGSNTEATAETVSTGVTKYDVGNFVVFFNATNTIAAIPEDKKETGYLVTIDSAEHTENGYTIASTATDVTSVPANSFVILKK